MLGMSGVGTLADREQPHRREEAPRGSQARVGVGLTVHDGAYFASLASPLFLVFRCDLLGCRECAFRRAREAADPTGTIVRLGCNLNATWQGSLCCFLRAQTVPS